MVFFDAWAELSLFSLAFSAVSFYLNKTLGQRDRVKSIQKEFQGYQKELQKAIVDKDEKKLEELKKHDKEMNEKMMQMLWLPWKASIVILPLVWILISWVLPPLYRGFVILLPFNIHLSAILSWTFYSNIFQTAAYGTTGFFIVCAIFFGLAMEGIASRLWPASPSK
ncbi:MAG: EMC3/TMCO1 family protein [Candidatus Micrarchaeota archaeon]